MARSPRGDAAREKKSDSARSQPRVRAKAGPERPIAARESTPGVPWDLPPLVVDAAFLRRAAEIADSLLDAPRPHPSRRGREFWGQLAGSSTFRPDADVMKVLLSLTKDRNKNVRLYAAQAIVEIGSSSVALPMQEPFAGAALNAMDSDDSDVRHAIVRGLKWLAKMSPQIRRKAFDCAVHGLKDKDGRIRAGCLDVLEAFGIDQVSSVANDIQEALSHESPSVRRSACNLLGWLGDDAIGATDNLISRVVNDQDEGVRRAAALAIAKINPSGDRIRFGPGDQALRDDLLRFLREAGAGGRALRRSLGHGQSKESSASASDLDLDSQLFDALSKTQLKFVQYLLKKGKPVSFSELSKSVWRGETTDGNIEKTVRRANERLLAEHLPLRIHTRNRHVSVTRDK